MSRIIGLAALVAIAIACIYSVRLALADAAFRRQTPEAVTRALQILPDRASYLLLRALQMDYNGEDSTALLETAARVNPVSSEPRIRLGLAAEARGDFPGAEKWLLDAARVDHQFEPRWTAANFYFRRERSDQFWKWIRSALEVSYGDRRLAFDLCWRMSQDPNEILARALPDKHEVLAAYLYYVLDRHREATGPVALKLAAWRNPADVPPLEVACDLLMDSGKIAEARELWRELGYSQAGLIANGDFATELRGHGFDWRPAHPPGVTDIQIPGEHRLVFSGQQPESCELLRQWVVLETGKLYLLRWETRTRDFASPTGIEWRAGEAHGLIEPGGDWRTGGLEFKAGASLMPIMLEYQRPTGQARAEGAIEIRNVSLVEKP